MTDPSQNAPAFKDLSAVTQSTGAMLNPAIAPRMGSAAVDPGTRNMGMQAINPGDYSQMMALPIDPTVKSLMMPPANPQTYGAWIGAMANP